jgi:hypothetical protein
MKQISRIAILILIGSLHLNSQIQIDSLLISSERDTTLIQMVMDGMGDIRKTYPKKIVRISDNKAYSDTFSNDLISSTTSIDAKFPLKTLVYFPSRNQINIYNSRWGVLSELKLDQYEFYQPSMVCYSFDETIWILDANSNVLAKISETATKKLVVNNPFLNQGIRYYPKKMFDFKYYSVAYDPKFGLFVIDNYGTLVSKVALEKNAQVFLCSGDLLQIENNNVYKLSITQDLQIHRSKKCIQFVDNIKSVVGLKSQIAVITKNGSVLIYRDFTKLLDQ